MATMDSTSVAESDPASTHPPSDMNGSSTSIATTADETIQATPMETPAVQTSTIAASPPSSSSPLRHHTTSSSNGSDKIMEQTWKYPYHQVSVLLDDADASLQRIMETTQCHITLACEPTPQHTQSRMVQVTLRGTSEQIFAAHKQLNFVRQNSNTKKKTVRFGGETTSHVAKSTPTKLKNWNLDVTDASMRRVVDRLISPQHSTDWAILKFADKPRTRREKSLAIDKYGIGGVRQLAKQLSHVKDLTYCLLRFDYGVEILKHQIILLIWSPSTARSGQKLNIIPILRHKSLIKQTLRATFELNISIHSYLNSNFILSELHLKHLVPEILLRVTKRFNTDDDGDDDDDDDDDEDHKMMTVSLEKRRSSLLKTNSTPSLPSSSTPKMTHKPSSPPVLVPQASSPNLQFSISKMDKFFASKNWTLRQLTAALAQRYKVDSPQQLQVTHILHFVVTKRTSPSKFTAPRRTEHVFEAPDVDKTLSMLGLYHGSQIYVSLRHPDQGQLRAHQQSESVLLSNVFLAAQRRLQFTKMKTMSKTKKIKIKLKLSSHIANMKSLQSLKKQKQAQKLKLQQKVSLRVEKWESRGGIGHNNETRPTSKSVFVTKKRKQPQEDGDGDGDVEMNMEQQQKVATTPTPTSTPMIPSYEKQASHSDPELTENKRTRGQRTRSASTTDAYVMQKREQQHLEVDAENGEEEQEAMQTRSASISLQPSFQVQAAHDDEDEDEDVELKHDDDDDGDGDACMTTASTSLPTSSASASSLSSSSSSLSSSSQSDLMNTTEIECTLDLNEVFIVERSIGRGKTAHVHYAVYKNECDIALKEFRFGRLTDKILLDFHNELETLKKLDHENICRLLGHYVDEPSKQLYLAFEWLPCGCLYDVLHDANVSIELVDVLEMAMDVARGMQYLHSQAIIHRDLKSHNLLLDEAYRVKITDFGTAKSMDKISGTTYTEVGTGGYCAPEVLEQPLQGYDRKVDVFSYGVLLWEILERGHVFDQRCLRTISELKKGLRPKISVAGCPPPLRQLIHDCWQFEPDKRPVFDEIVKVLEPLLAEYKKEEKNDENDGGDHNEHDNMNDE